MDIALLDHLIITDESYYSFGDEEIEIGVDEAGRGPVLGPMVYGVAFWPAREGLGQEMREEFGFNDSK